MKMPVKTKEVRKLLVGKVAQLNDIIADIDALLVRMEVLFYRVTIFGSARIVPEGPIYKQVYELANELASRGVDIVTGGGPGLMEAANKGAKEGSINARSIGLPIELPFEADANSHLDVKHHHKRFSSRLDEFMRISHAVVVTPGGIGTVLELLYTWQLLQVKHINPRPIILLGGDFWKGFLEWFRNESCKRELMSESDMDMLTIVDSVSDVIQFLEPHIVKFQKNSERYRKNKM